MKIIHVNYSLRNEYESDLRSNEHYLSSIENMALKKWVRKNGAGSDQPLPSYFSATKFTTQNTEEKL